MRLPVCGQGQIQHGGVHAIRQVIHPLEILAPRHHQLTGGKQGFKPALFVLPAPPGTGPAVCAFKVRGFDGAVQLNVLQQFIELRPLLLVAGLAPFDAPVLAHITVVGTVQRQVLRGHKAGFVRPRLKHMGVGQCLIQPLHRVMPQA